jgi:hypothetical protein
MIEAFTRLDSEILAQENLSPGSRLTTAEAWVQHLENMQLKVDDMTSDKPPLDVISEIDESILDEEKVPASALERDRNDIVKVKNVCTCSYELVVRCIQINETPITLHSIEISSRVVF